MGQDHSPEAEFERVVKAAIAQGIASIQPGETRDLDLSDQSVYVHFGGLGVNITKITVQRP